MNKFLTNLQHQAEENPLFAVGVGLAAFTAFTKFISVAGDQRGRYIWGKEVKRRERKHSKK